MYRLKRDDGVEFRVSANIWEDALELAYLYGWRPAGTETPQTEIWRGRRTPWDSQDYFSLESQHVGRDDARALAEAVFRALPPTPDYGSPVVEREPVLVESTSSSGRSRASAIADEQSGSRKKVMRRFAAFADCGGFTIDGAQEPSP